MWKVNPPLLGGSEKLKVVIWYELQLRGSNGESLNPYYFRSHRLATSFGVSQRKRLGSLYAVNFVPVVIDEASPNEALAVLSFDVIRISTLEIHRDELLVTAKSHIRPEDRKLLSFSIFDNTPYTNGAIPPKKASENGDKDSKESLKITTFDITVRRKPGTGRKRKTESQK